MPGDGRSSKVVERRRVEEGRCVMFRATYPPVLTYDDGDTGMIWAVGQTYTVYVCESFIFI